MVPHQFTGRRRWKIDPQACLLLLKLLIEAVSSM